MEMVIKKLVTATKNREKLVELARMLEGLDIEIVSLSSFPGIEEAEETGGTFEENAAIKALYYCAKTALPCVADDSGLEVEALDGAPGVKSARYAGPGATSEDLCRKLLGEMKDVPDDSRNGRFRCCIAFAVNGQVVLTASGEAKGRIIREMRGTGGFGYDPVFVPEGFEKTYAQMQPGEKDAISHRGKALRSFKDKFEKLIKESVQG